MRSEFAVPRDACCRRPRFWLRPQDAVRSLKRVGYGRSKKENVTLTPQYAALSPRPQIGGVCRMPELRRTQAAAPSVRRLRLLRWPGSDDAAIRNGLRVKRRREAAHL